MDVNSKKQENKVSKITQVIVKTKYFKTQDKNIAGPLRLVKRHLSYENLLM